MVSAGQRLGEYVLIDRIGSGAFGEVWLAHHHAWTDQVVAIKIPTDPQYVRNLQKEGAAIRRLAHPNIVRAINFDPFAEQPYLVMEYVPGASLRKLLQRAPLRIDAAVAIIKQVLAALHHAHRNGIIHRDIKPENILIHKRALTDGGEMESAAKLTDFGLGKTAVQTQDSILFSRDDRGGGQIVGTHQYMAPEQMEGNEVDARADLYACGVVLFEMLTGKRPAGTEVPSDLNPEVPEQLDEIYRRAVARWERRFTSAKEFFHAIEQAAELPGADSADAIVHEASDAALNGLASALAEQPGRPHGAAPNKRYMQMGAVIVGMLAAGTTLALLLLPQSVQTPRVAPTAAQPPATARLPAKGMAESFAPARPDSPPPVAMRIAASPTTAPITPLVQPASEPVNARVLAPQRPPRPPIQPVAASADELTEQRINDAITRGAEFLFKQFDSARHELRNIPQDPPAIHTGLDALCVYALLQCNEAIDDARFRVRGPFMKGCIDRLKQMPISPEYATYTHAIRATALALHHRDEDRTTLRADAAWLVKAASGGAYTYDTSYSTGGPGYARNVWDNSNSQYGLLGVWSAAEAGVEVPTNYWKDVEKHWTACQALNGQWDYQSAGPAGTLSMTAAGVASLLVTHDYLDGPRYAGNVGLPPFPGSLHRALDWFEDGDNAVNLDTSQWWGYTLYGIGRVGLASGFKYFGPHDWYRELTSKVLRRQRRDGAWDGVSLSDTAYALLFLSRGSHPIVMNKLRFKGFWDNRPRDLANLARFSGEQLDRPLNWQVVSFSHDWTDWTDSPILYLSSHKVPEIGDDQIDAIRDFVMAGGLLFTQADGDSKNFDEWATSLAAKLFPDYPLSPLPEDNDLWSVALKVNPKPPLKAVSNGARLLMVHSPTDLSRTWQGGDEQVKRNVFDLGLNLFIYASGKRDLRGRLGSPFIPPVDAAPLNTVAVARIRYKGNWDPEPGAWVRFGRWFQQSTGWKVDARAVSFRELSSDVFPMAHLTGTDAITFTPDEAKAIGNYVRNGGVLLIDVCGGRGSFEQSVRLGLLSAAFPDMPTRPLDPAHPMLTTSRPGMDDIARPRLRLFFTQNDDTATPLPAALSAGKGMVIFTPLDLTSGLLGTGTWGIAGYTPGYCESFMKNAVLWSFDRRL